MIALDEIVHYHEEMDHPDYAETIRAVDRALREIRELNDDGHFTEGGDGSQRLDEILDSVLGKVRVK